MYLKLYPEYIVLVVESVDDELFSNRSGMDGLNKQVSFSRE